MKRKLLYLFLLFSIFQVKCLAIEGGEITYKYIGNNKFDVTFKAYRDCRDISMNNLNFSILCVSSGSTLSLNAKLVSIKDISTVCASTGIKCNPSNAQIPVTIPIFEEHTYAYTLDFNGNESAFINCCTIKIGMGRCCRISKISTMGSGKNFWVTSTLALCSAPTNSSPVFSNTPVFTALLNQGMYRSFMAYDTIDFDSLSYSFTDPLESFTGKVKWDTGFSSKSPISVYWPAGYDKTKGPKPDANPPIGIYLDPETGDLVATPTDTFTSVMAISVKEWRKDSTGKYIQIGEIVRDIGQIVKIAFGVKNNPPILKGPYKYKVCAGTQICFNITTDDKQFIPPPPAKANPPDTLTLIWSSNIKGASFNIADPKARLKTGKFCWLPNDSDIRDQPYRFSVTAMDNSCQLRAVTSKTYAVSVYPMAKTKVIITKISDNKMAVKSQLVTPFVGTPYYYWNLSDSLNIQSGINQGYFLKSKLSPWKRQFDTLVFRKNGKYFIHHQIYGAPYYCSNSYVDTIKISGILEVSLMNKTDTMVCKNVMTRFNAKVINGQKPFNYSWTTKSRTQTDTLGYFDQAFVSKDTILLSVTDSKGNSNSTVLYVTPESLLISAGPDKISCPGISVNIKAKNLLNNDTLSWQWSKGGVVVSNADSVKTDITGTYIVKAENMRGCVAYDTMQLNSYKPTVLFKDSYGKYCQNKNELKQSEIFNPSINPDLMSNYQWTLLRSLKNDSGSFNTLNDLLVDEDASPKYDFKIKFGKNFIDLKSSPKDSLIFSLKVMDANNCVTNDTMTVNLVKDPSIDFSTHKDSICYDEGIDLNAKVKTDGVPKWMAADPSGYDAWPVTGEIVNGIVKAKNFKTTGGRYFVKLISTYDICTSSDSIDIFVIRVPVPKVGHTRFLDSIRFTDNSLYASNRKWYLDNLYVNNTKDIVFSKLAVNNKPVRLELSNTNCSSDTTFTLNTTGVTNLKNKLISIYPNPAYQDLTIKQLQPCSNCNYEIYNMVGECILKGDLQQMETVVNISDFANGPYVLQVKNEKMSYSFQFIKGDF